MVVRDERDVIAANLEHHLALGVDEVLVTDNLSADGTRDILADYEQTGRVRVWTEPGRDFRQADWVTRMARFAAVELEADWLVHADADEFWWPPGLDVGRALAEVDDDMIVVPRWNLVGPVEEEGTWPERLVNRDARAVNARGSGLQPKVAHRADPHVSVAEGNHRAVGPLLQRTGTPGGWEVLHVPERSWAQYARKIEQGAQAIARHPRHGSDVQIAAHWRAEYADLRAGTLERQYRARKFDAPAGRESFVVDTRLRDRIRWLSDHALAPATLASATRG